MLTKTQQYLIVSFLSSYYEEKEAEDPDVSAGLIVKKLTKKDTFKEGVNDILKIEKEVKGWGDAWEKKAKTIHNLLATAVNKNEKKKLKKISASKKQEEKKNFVDTSIYEKYQARMKKTSGEAKQHKKILNSFYVFLNEGYGNVEDWFDLFEHLDKYTNKMESIYDLEELENVK